MKTARRSRSPSCTNRARVDPSPRWRAVSLPLSDLSGTVTVAQDISGIDATVQRLVLIELAVGSVVLVLLGGLGLLGLAAFGLAASTSYAMLAFFAVVAGLGNGVFHPVDYTLINRKEIGRASCRERVSSPV